MNITDEQFYNSIKHIYKIKTQKL